jgi:hypothetical protein
MNTVQLIIGFHPKIPESVRLSIHQKIGALLVEQIQEIHTHVVTVPKEKLRSYQEHYASCKHVRYVERNKTLRITHSNIWKPSSSDQTKNP